MIWARKINKEDRDEKSAMQQFNSGEMSFQQWQQETYMRIRASRLPELLECRAAGKWREFCEIALKCYEVMQDAFIFYDEVPDNMKYDFAIDAYIHHGDSIPAVRKAVRGALKYGRPTLPEELKGVDAITIYRAGEEPLEKSKYRISWTVSKDIALFFLNEWSSRHANFLYRGKIRPEHIIAYCNEREEKEVMQYGHVYDIEDITPADNILKRPLLGKSKSQLV